MGGHFALLALGLRLFGHGGRVYVVALVEIIATFQQAETVGVPRARSHKAVVHGFAEHGLDAGDDLVGARVGLGILALDW